MRSVPRQDASGCTIVVTRASGILGTLRRRRHVTFPVDRYLVNADKGFVYCPIPKNANTSVKLWFLHTLGVDTSTFRPGEVHDHVRTRQGLAGLTPRRADQILDRSLTFVVVRNPWSRVVSGYVDKFVKQPPSNPPSRRVVKSYKRQLGLEVHALDFERGLSFREFVDHLCGTSDHLLNPHWMPQHRFLGGRRFDVEVRFERLDVDMAALNRRLGVDAPTPRSNITPYVDVAAAGDLADVPSGALRQLTDLPSRPPS